MDPFTAAQQAAASNLTEAMQAKLGAPWCSAKNRADLKKIWLKFGIDFTTYLYYIIGIYRI